MSRVYMCDVCKKVNDLQGMNEVTRKYIKQNVLFGVTERQETLHICVNCWDRIKEEQRDGADEASYEQVKS